MNVQYVHAALSARRAWPSFSCRCVSTGEACQTPGSPFQRCQRTCQVLSGARIENKGGENKGGEGVFVISTKAIKGSQQKWQEAMDTAHSLQKLYLCNFLITQRKEIQYQLQTVRWKNWYLKSGSVHIPGQFSSPSTGYHEHFIGVHLQKETLVSAQVKPTSWSEASKPCKQRFHETKLLVWGIA